MRVDVTFELNNQHLVFVFITYAILLTDKLSNQKLHRHIFSLYSVFCLKYLAILVKFYFPRTYYTRYNRSISSHFINQDICVSCSKITERFPHLFFFFIFEKCGDCPSRTSVDVVQASTCYTMQPIECSIARRKLTRYGLCACQ